MTEREMLILVLLSRLSEERFAVFGRDDDEAANIIDELLSFVVPCS